MEGDRDDALAREVAALRAQVAAQQVVAVKEKRHGVPLLLSFFIPGLGQLVKGHIFRGIAIFAASAFSVVLMSIYIGFITTPAIWIWQLIDAYRSPD